MRLRGWIAPGPCPKVRIRSSSGRAFTVTVDTGFTGELALPFAEIRRLGFEGPVSEDPCILADGTVTRFPVYRGSVKWLGQVRPVIAFGCAADEGLLGMAMLKGTRLTVEMDRGRVAVEKV